MVPLTRKLSTAISMIYFITMIVLCHRSTAAYFRIYTSRDENSWGFGQTFVVVAMTISIYEISLIYFTFSNRKTFASFLDPEIWYEIGVYIMKKHFEDSDFGIDSREMRDRW